MKNNMFHFKAVFLLYIIAATSIVQGESKIADVKSAYMTSSQLVRFVRPILAHMQNTKWEKDGDTIHFYFEEKLGSIDDKKMAWYKDFLKKGHIISGHIITEDSISYKHDTAKEADENGGYKTKSIVQTSFKLSNEMSKLLDVIIEYPNILKKKIKSK